MEGTDGGQDQGHMHAPTGVRRAVSKANQPHSWHTLQTRKMFKLLEFSESSFPLWFHRRHPALLGLYFLAPC